MAESSARCNATLSSAPLPLNAKVEPSAARVTSPLACNMASCTPIKPKSCSRTPKLRKLTGPPRKRACTSPRSIGKVSLNSSGVPEASALGASDSSTCAPKRAARSVLGPKFSVSPPWLKRRLTPSRFRPAPSGKERAAQAESSARPARNLAPRSGSG